VSQEQKGGNVYPETHKIFLDFLERRRKENDRQWSNGGPFVGRRDTRNLLNASGEKEE